MRTTVNLEVTQHADERFYERFGIVQTSRMIKIDLNDWVEVSRYRHNKTGNLVVDLAKRGSKKILMIVDIETTRVVTVMSSGYLVDRAYEQIKIKA
jgi:hypothetical protein